MQRKKKSKSENTKKKKKGNTVTDPRISHTYIPVTLRYYASMNKGVTFLIRSRYANLMRSKISQRSHGRIILLTPVCDTRSTVHSIAWAFLMLIIIFNVDLDGHTYRVVYLYRKVISMALLARTWRPHSAQPYNGPNPQSNPSTFLFFEFWRSVIFSIIT